ncbi:MAG: radical SAM protein, partial [Prevotellaceae bacterium]|nr:radical SAM protein [Prevotellaceae bacterium]
MAHTPSFFIVPSLACQASCKYCFGPHRGAVMDERTAKETVIFIRSIAEETAAKELSIVFHGGEPLLAPFPVWQTMLDEIDRQLAGYDVRMNMQSNLWNLDGDFLTLFRDHKVSFGTSLDGPKDVCDLTRGEGYYDRTYAAVKRANAVGSPVSAIATVASQTLPHALEIVKYFRNNGMSLVLHGAIAGMDKRGSSDSSFALTAGEYAAMIKELFPWYVKNRKYTRIDTFDHFVKGIVHGQPGVCTFRDCFGMFLSIAPTGDVVSCQRLAGKKEFSMGNIFDRPTLAGLYDSPAARAQQEREKRVGERCSGCDVYPVCKGGCYYHALSSGDGAIDPLCKAYKEIYAFVQERLINEMQTPENIEAIASRPATSNEHPLFRRGAYISLSNKTHPSHVADNARRTLAIHELGRTGSPRAAAENLYAQKICGNIPLTEKLLVSMQRDMYRSRAKRNNCYVHITFNCNLRCTHCYADAGSRRDEMSPEQFGTLAAEAVGAGFRQIVITGGEPSV